MVGLFNAVFIFTVLAGQRVSVVRALKLREQIQMRSSSNATAGTEVLANATAYLLSPLHLNATTSSNATASASHALFASVVLGSNASASSMAASNASVLALSSSSVNLTAGEKRRDEQHVIWITAFPRSGSTTALGMFSFKSRLNGRHTLAVFEPCHGLAPQPSNDILEHEGCHRELGRIMDCNWGGGVQSIGSWTNGDGDFLYTPTPDDLPHSPPEVQAQHCRRSDVIVFKTVTYGHDLHSQASPLLEKDNRLRVVDIVRDPRAIYASWRTTEPFKAVATGQQPLNEEAHDQGWFYGLTGICDVFAQNSKTSHARVHRLRFEDLIADPTTTVKSAYEFVGLPFGRPEINWINSAFNAKCKDSDVGDFMNCHRNSTASLSKWRNVLTPEEQAEFLAHPNCREVAHLYGYPLD